MCTTLVYFVRFSYGTKPGEGEGCKQALEWTKRDRLRDVIGTESEELVYRFCSSSPADVWYVCPLHAVCNNLMPCLSFAFERAGNSSKRFPMAALSSLRYATRTQTRCHRSSRDNLRNSRRLSYPTSWNKVSQRRAWKVSLRDDFDSPQRS